MSDIKPLVFTLPYPVSANRYWRPVRIGAHITIVPTKEAKQYKKAVAWLLRSQGVRDVLPGRMTVHLRLYPKRPLDYRTRMRKHGDLWDDTVQRLDLDNARKVVYDALKDIAIADDKCIFKDTGEVMEPDGRDACVMVAIVPYVRTPAVQQTLEIAPAADPEPSGMTEKQKRTVETPF